ACGMNDVVTKPIDVAVLLDKLAGWTSRRGGPRGIDFEGALKRLGGKEPLLLDLLADFATEQGDAVAAIRAHLAAGETAEAIRLAHSLKGNAANLGVADVFEHAKSLEAALKNGGAANPPAELLGKLEQVLAEALESIRELPAARAAQTFQA